MKRGSYFYKLSNLVEAASALATSGNVHYTSFNFHLNQIFRHNVFFFLSDMTVHRYLVCCYNIIVCPINREPKRDERDFHLGQPPTHMKTAKECSIKEISNQF